MRARIKARMAEATGPRVDVIVTTLGGVQTARAVRAGGGLVGIRSSETPPEVEGAPGSLAAQIDFLDWPFAVEEEASVEEHLEMARDLTPKYAVAPDVQADRPLAEAVDVAERLDLYADHVIMVPKTVPVDDIPNQYVVGLPFRDEWDTDLGVNSWVDFQARPVHILGGNPTDQLNLAQRFQLEVTSIDSPNPLSWADFGRVWVARKGGANEVRDIIVQEIVDSSFRPDRTREQWEERDYEDMDVEEFLDAVAAEMGRDWGWPDPEATAALDIPTMRQLLTSRHARIKFTVMNLREGWNEGRTVRTAEAVAPGRGPPPPAPPGLGDPERREERLERWLEAAMEERVGELEPTERGLSTFGGGDASPERRTDSTITASPERTIVLVGCGEAKQEGAAEARELYTSTYFQLKRGYAEAVAADEWYVLSAENGLVQPETVIPCYDTEMDDVEDERWARRVLGDLPDLSNAEVVVLAGPDYLDPLEARLRARAARVSAPTRGMEIGDRMAWLSEHTPETDDGNGGSDTRLSEFG